MRKQIVNFPLAALAITIVGAIGTFAIIDAAATADHYGYGNSLPQQQSGEVPSISEVLEESESETN